MCETCGCGDPEVVPVEIQERLLAENDHHAQHNREHLAELGALTLNLMGSPGCGKTALLEATAAAAPAGWRLAAMSGDLATDRDAERLRGAGIPAVGLTTGSACHLDARLVHHGLHQLEGKRFDLLFVENVGNLVCPAIYDLGQNANVVVLSVTEGEDKPLKYPVMFHHADLVVISKIDLVPHVGVDLDLLIGNLERVMPDPTVLELSARTGEGMETWIAWLERSRTTARGALPRRPAVAGG
jgi:hydrogenase nickel incorporation protein HypB